MTPVPKLLITPWMRMLPTEIKLCCKMLGTAMTANFRNSGQEKILAVFSVCILPSRRKTTRTASTQLIPWHKKVAQATPATPISKAVTKRMSARILLVEEQARKMKGVRESPRAEKIPVETL